MPDIADIVKALELSFLYKETYIMRIIEEFSAEKKR